MSLLTILTMLTTHRSVRRVVLAGLALTTAACASPAVTPLPTPATDTARARYITSSAGGEVEAPQRADAVAGSTWRGEYSATGLARRAPLELTLRGAHEPPEVDDALEGELSMVVVRGTDTFDAGDAHTTRLLVRAPLASVSRAGRRLRLVTRPFVDPVCGCTVTATFVGTVRGDAIDGRFSFAGPATRAAHAGRWRAARVAEPAMTARAPLGDG